MTAPYLTGIFASSPIGPLQKHMSEVLTCARTLEPFIQAVLDDDRTTMQTLHQAIIDAEHRADEVKRELRLGLPTSLFMPVDRRDMLSILSMQDNLADEVRDVAGIICARGMSFPVVLADNYMNLVRQSIKACEVVNTAVCELDELIATGFDNAERRRISKLLVEVDTLESETDHLAAALNTALMSLEQEMPPIEVMFLYRVLDQTSNIADCAHKVGSRLQLLLAR